MLRLSRIHSSDAVKFIGKSVEEISSWVVFKGGWASFPFSLFYCWKWKLAALGAGARVHTPVLLLTHKQASSPVLPSGSPPVCLPVSAVPQAEKATKSQCSCAWFWASRQVAAGQHTCRDCLKWPSPEAWLAAGWSLHSSQLDIRGDKLLWKPGPMSSAVPSKPPGLVLGIAAWADLPGALQSTDSAAVWGRVHIHGQGLTSQLWAGKGPPWLNAVAPAFPSSCSSVASLLGRNYSWCPPSLPRGWMGLLGGGALIQEAEVGGKWACSAPCLAWPRLLLSGGPLLFHHLHCSSSVAH